MSTIKVNETHNHAVYEKTKELHYFRFAAEGLIFFPLKSFWEAGYANFCKFFWYDSTCMQR